MMCGEYDGEGVCYFGSGCDGVGSNSDEGGWKEKKPTTTAINTSTTTNITNTKTKYTILKKYS